MWSGSVASIPAGWVLCNGANGTPNLEGMFIVGAGGAYAPGNTGGAASNTPAITVAGHALTISEMPTHAHTDVGHTHTDAGHVHEQAFSGFGYTPGGNGGSSGDPGGGTLYATTSGQADIQMAAANIQSNGGGTTHSHTATSSAVPTLPPYYALAFIMKT
jgi:hypothetical protein